MAQHSRYSYVLLSHLVQSTCQRRTTGKSAWESDQCRGICPGTKWQVHPTGADQKPGNLQTCGTEWGGRPRLSKNSKYRGADKSLALPGRKQVRKHVRDARDFNNIETRAVIKFFFLQGKAPKEIYAVLTETLACFLSSRARIYQHASKSKKTYWGRTVLLQPKRNISRNETTLQSSWWRKWVARRVILGNWRRERLPVASGVPRGGLGCSTPPRNSEGPPKSCQTQPDLWKLLKMAEFRTPTHQDVREKKAVKF